MRVRGVRVSEDSVWVRVEDALFLGERLLSLSDLKIINCVGERYLI